MKKIVFFLLIVSICSSCKMTDEKEEVSCTDDFRSFGIKVQYPDSSPAVLDSFKVVWGDRELTDLLDWELAQIAGYYPLVDDGLQGALNGLSVSVTAYGYLDGKEVFREDYLVGADECHVAYYDEKPFIVTIENGEEVVMCSKDFLSFGIKVQYPDGSPVVLDSFKVVWGDRELTDLLDWELAQIAGYYPLVDDGLQGELKGLSVSVTAYGYLDGKEVFREDYLVGADECHVAYYDEKPFIVTIENGE